MHTKQSIRIKVAAGFWQRFRGLMWARTLPDDQALLIENCRCVHTFFMRFALDVIYLNQNMQIVKMHTHVPPWRMRWGSADAQHTLEMAAGGVDRFHLRIGDTLD